VAGANDSFQSKYGAALGCGPFGQCGKQPAATGYYPQKAYELSIEINKKQSGSYFNYRDLAGFASQLTASQYVCCFAFSYVILLRCCRAM
jgi:hypothetical protein